MASTISAADLRYTIYTGGHTTVRVEHLPTRQSATATAYTTASARTQATQDLLVRMNAKLEDER